MNPVFYDAQKAPSITAPPVPLFPPLARSAAGATIDEVLTALEVSLHDGQHFVSLTLAWRRVLPFADEKAIARAQQKLASRHRERVRKAGLAEPFILSVFEKTTKMGLHGHLMMGCPPGPLDRWLDAVIRQLVREYGPLPVGFPWLNGHHAGKIKSSDAARGACAYILKSAVEGNCERGIRRGTGLLSIPMPAIRRSRGRRR